MGKLSYSKVHTGPNKQTKPAAIHLQKQATVSVIYEPLDLTFSWDAGMALRKVALIQDVRGIPSENLVAEEGNIRSQDALGLQDQALY